jgi:selenide,water dikinase
MGQIAACNVTNDLFAMNAIEVLNYNAFLAIPKDMPQDIVVKIMEGQKDFLEKIGTTVQGGHTIYNPWPLMGGSASAIVRKEEMKQKSGAKAGDHLILTKPMGIQPLMTAYRVQYSDPSLLEEVDTSHLTEYIEMAVKSMTTSNQSVSKVIHEGKFFDVIDGMTDITGFGFKTHLSEMLIDSDLGVEIQNLPVFPLAPALSDVFGYPLEMGKAAETAGAMLMAVDSDSLADFETALSDSQIWWRDVGLISTKFKDVHFADSFELIEVDDY